MKQRAKEEWEVGFLIGAIIDIILLAVMFL